MKRIALSIVATLSLGIFTVMRALGNAAPHEAPSYRIDSATPVMPTATATEAATATPSPDAFAERILELVAVLIRILREILAGLPVG